MTILKQSFGWIRKPHVCLGCERVFKPSVKMHYQRIASDDLYTVWTCETCESLKAFLDPEEGVWEQGFVSNVLNRGETPESILADFRNAN